MADVDASRFGDPRRASDRLLLERGAVWRESLIIDKQVGSASAPITVGAYGTGAAPIVRGSDLVSGFTAASEVGTNVYVRDLSGPTPVSSVTQERSYISEKLVFATGKDE